MSIRICPAPTSSAHNTSYTLRLFPESQNLGFIKPNHTTKKGVNPDKIQLFRPKKIICSLIILSTLILAPNKLRFHYSGYKGTVPSFKKKIKHFEIKKKKALVLENSHRGLKVVSVQTLRRTDSLRGLKTSEQGRGESLLGPGLFCF